MKPKSEKMSTIRLPLCAHGHIVLSPRSSILIFRVRVPFGCALLRSSAITVQLSYRHTVTPYSLLTPVFHHSPFSYSRLRQHAIVCLQAAEIDGHAINGHARIYGIELQDVPARFQGIRCHRCQRGVAEDV